MKTSIAQILLFIKQLRVLAWLEMFEKWFGFFVKLIWIGAFIAFSIYLYNEYHKNVFYLKDFKVPNTWAEQGYTGEVVKEAILDEIDKVNQEIALQLGVSISSRSYKSTRNKNNDNAQILNDINVEGFNLKVIVKTILSFFGKKDKNIGGYIILTDSSQTMSIQITNQTVKEFSISRQHPIKNLIHDATLHIMQVKQPYNLLIYYLNRNDSTALIRTFDYLVKNREVIKDNDFYEVASNVSTIVRDFEKADAWADSLVRKYPNNFDSYWCKASASFNRIRYSDTDSLEKVKYNRLFVENLQKCIIHHTRDGEDVSLAYVYLQLSRYYFRQKNAKLGEEYAVKSNKIEPFNAYANNQMCYAQIDVKNYTKAEKYIMKAIEIEPDNANFWDSLSEVYALQDKDSLSVVYLKKALQSPIKVGTVSIEAYRKDPRWKKLQKRRDFQALLHK